MRTTHAYGVKLVRGPVVSIPPHSGAAASSAEMIERMASRSHQQPLAADIFCGAGGLSLGLSEAGYNVVLGIDNDPVALETYAGLHPGLALCRDLSTRAAIDEVTGLLRELDVELLAGGPPCQPFSRAGASKIRSLVQSGVRPEHDDRRDLWQAFLEIVLSVHPRAVLLENVPDMAIAADTTIVRTLVSELEAAGYAVHTALLRSCDHGVPQIRQRFFLVALAERGGFSWPSPLDTEVTVDDAIADLPPVEGGWRPPAAAEGFLPYPAPRNPGPFVRRARQGLDAADRSRIYDHITRPVRADDRVIFESMNSTTRYADIEPSLRRYRHDIFDDKYKRLDWKRPSRSITAHIARDGYWYIHPEQARTLTLREAARLQTFPDRVRFAGPPSAAFRQIGNAVPPLLAERVALSIRDALDRPQQPPATSIDVSSRLAQWFEDKRHLALPWLRAQTAWAALQGHLLLERAPTASVDVAWPTLEKLDSPERTIESADLLHDLANIIGRPRHAERVLNAALRTSKHPEAMASSKALQETPGVTPRAAAVAALADPRMGSTPVVVNQGTLRVASRVFGLPQPTRSPGSAGRLAVTRLLGGSRAKTNDKSRITMAAVLELAASLCTANNPSCSQCPLNGACQWPRRRPKMPDEHDQSQ